MRGITIQLAVALLCTACVTPDVQQDAAGTATGSAVASAPAAAPGSPNEMICQNEQVTGSLGKERVCMTRAQREAMAAYAKSETGDAQRRGDMGTAKGN